MEGAKWTVALLESWRGMKDSVVNGSPGGSVAAQVEHLLAPMLAMMISHFSVG